MIPYYQDPAVTIYCGDCREILPSLAGEFVTITDPPYGETSLEWDRWVNGWPLLVAERSRSMWCFGSFRMFVDRWRDFDGWRASQDIVWEKHNGSSARKDRFRRVHELAVHFYRGEWEAVYHQVPTTPEAKRRKIKRQGQPVHWNGIGTGTFTVEEGGPLLARSVLQVRSCHGHAVNETQKPEGIVRPLMEYAAGPGAVILDPFGGSGTVAVVAKSMGLRAVMIERRESQCEEAVARLAQQLLSLA